MKKILFPLMVAAAMVAGNIHAQEISAGGSQEVQASFSTLKTMIREINIKLTAVSGTANLARVEAGNALISATEAWRKARDAERLAMSLESCSLKRMFYKPRAPEADGQGCVEVVDASSEEGINAITGSVTERNIDDEIKSVGKSANMILSLSCSVQRPTITCVPIQGKDGNYYGTNCGTAPTIHYSVGLGQGGNKFQEVASGSVRSMTNFYNGYTLQSTFVVPGTPHVVNLSYFSYNGKLFKGRIVATPRGNRIAEKKFVMNMADWNGDIKFKNCSGNAEAFYYAK